MAASASRSRMLYRHLRLSETYRSLCGVAKDCVHNVISREHTVSSLQGATTQTPGLTGGSMFHAGDGDGASGDERLRGGFDAGSQGTDHYGDGGGNNGGRHDGSSNANGDGNSPYVDSSRKNLSGEKTSQSPVSQESAGTSPGSSLKAGPSTSIKTAGELHRLLVLDTPW